MKNINHEYTKHEELEMAILTPEKLDLKIQM